MDRIIRYCRILKEATWHSWLTGKSNEPKIQSKPSIQSILKINDIQSLFDWPKEKRYAAVKALIPYSVSKQDIVNNIKISITLVVEEYFIGYEMFLQGNNDDPPNEDDENISLKEFRQQENDYERNSLYIIKFYTKDPTNIVEISNMKHIFDEAVYLAKSGLNAAQIGKTIESEFSSLVS